MPLPSLKQKYYETKIISTGKTVHYRAFTTKEQKEIMLVQEVKNNTRETYNAIIKMLQNCIEEEIDFNSLYVVDFEKLFYEIKSVSMGDETTIEYTCPNTKCKTKKINLTIDTLKDFKFNDKPFETEIEITPTIKAGFKHITIDNLLKTESKKYNKEEEKFFDILVDGLYKVVDGEKVLIRGSGFNKEDAEKFCDEFPMPILNKVVDFYTNIPQLECQKEFECPDCKEKFKMDKGALQSFLS